MGLRFRRSWGVIPGIRFSLGLKGGSVSFGTRGLRYTVGTGGHRITAGIPGTGLYWTQKLKAPFGATAQKNQLPAATSAKPAQAQQPSTIPFTKGAGAAQSLTPPRQTLSPGVVGGQPPQLGQPHQSTLTPLQSLRKSGAAKALALSGYSASATNTYHLVIPAWLFWAALTVMVIAGLCFISAVIGSLVR
jgi:Protein of unknown function (DUF4236)